MGNNKNHRTEREQEMLDDLDKLYYPDAIQKDMMIAALQWADEHPIENN